MSFRSFARHVMFADVKKIVVLARTKVLQPEDLPALPDRLRARVLPFAERDLDVSSGKRLVLSLFRQGRRFVLPAMAFNFTYVTLNLTKPLLVNQFIARLSSDTLRDKTGLGVAVALAVALGAVSFVASLSVQHYFLRMLGTYQIFTNAINRLVFKHSLVLTQHARAESQIGDVVNHIGSDSDSVADAGMILGDFTISVATLLGASVLLFYFLGWTALASIGLLLLLIPLTRKVARSFSDLDEELMRHRDQRVTLMSQVLNGIRVVKYFAWEKSALEEVGAVRTLELRARKRLAQAEALATLSYVCVSTVVLFASLAVHIYRGYALTPELAFTCVALFAMLEDPLGNLSQVISRIAQAFVSAERICRFLRRDRLVSIGEGRADEALPGVEAESLAVQYQGQDQASLSGISFRILPGESVAVVGPVGAGKSTLLQTLLREVPLREGSLSYLDQRGKTVVPRIAYVPQEAFIFNGSLKENLLFGTAENESQLATALRVSCLEDDLAQLPAGLYTEIGERGVNLSGGQKQRVSLARAVIHEPTLALLDDPLSAVDARTEGELIERLLFGAWKGITRVVVTHRLAYLSRFDKVLYVVDGKLRAVGTLDELTTNCREFRAFFAEAAKSDHGAHLLGAAPKEATTAAVPGLRVTESRVTEDEDRAVGAVKGSVYKDYLYALGGSAWRRRSVVLPLLFLTSIGASALPLLQRSWLALSSNLQSGMPSAAGWLEKLAAAQHSAILVYGGLGLLTLTGVLVNRLFWLERGIAAGKDMHDHMLRSVLRAPLRFFDSTPIGRILQRFSRDVEAVDIQLQWSFETTVRCLVNIGTALFLILSVLPVMLLVVAPVLWLYYRLQRDYRVPAREAKRLDSISRSPRFAHFKETLQGLVVIRSYGKSGVFLEGFYDRLEHSQRMFFGHYMLNRWFSSRIPLLGGIISSGTALGIVLYAYTGWISAGVAGLVMVYALTLWESLNWAVRIFAEVEARMTSVERLKYYASLESEVDVQRPTPAPLAEPWPAQGEVVFDCVVARYAAHLPPVLKGISFRVPAGSRVGIIGRTGSGKSTILQALFRVMELEGGEIRIDGVNIASVPLERLRRSLAIIPQDPTLFLGTLRSNLDRYREYADEEIWEALRKARLASYVERLPGRLDAPVAENGSNLSQGQRQLLCLARALLADAKVIVMDEATASVDVQTDGLVQEVVRESCRNVTMLVIAHRLGTVADSDLILEIREGVLHRTLDLKKASEGVPVC
jgi:ABC-type multidrug transport system fused ATPase/permease subunit